MATVKDYKGNTVDFEAASAYMDSEICEQIIASGDCDTDQQFFDLYAQMHAEKFDGEEFAPYYGGAW